ncbi:hypothetical protein [Aestuariivita boseongensis]|uniref:hypothetical protein n=1 Tax=Aestuariivita boseongensis TaxID=1470562 RepID=UPI0006834891|nr:hypothetical protein [Aestuariivita boseongensis]
MTWSDLTMNWGEWFARIKHRFPNLDDGAMPFAKTDRARFEAYLADTHDLTLNEAREELDDFLFVEQLAREAFDFRARSEA